MLFTTVSQFVVLGVLLVVGWLFGFASHSGGKKWRQRYDEECEAHAAYRNDADTRLRDNGRRIAELERDHGALAAQLAEAQAIAATPPPVETVPVPVADDAAHNHAEPAAVEVPAEAAPAPLAASAAVAAFPSETVAAPAAAELENAEADHNNHDDLARIRGIDADMRGRLHALGVATFGDVEKLSAEDEMALEQRLDVPAGYIAREQWRDQAALLRAENDEEHGTRFVQA